MAHRTQLYLDDDQYQYLKTLSRSQGKSIAQIVRDWINQRRGNRSLNKFAADPFWKLRGIGSSGRPDISENFDDTLYGTRK
jgi:hypothetical protein